MINPTEAAAFAFSFRAAQRDAKRLQAVERRLFSESLDVARIERLDDDALLSDRIEDKYFETSAELLDSIERIRSKAAALGIKGFNDDSGGERR